MRGFTERALVLFSDPVKYDESLSYYRSEYRKALMALQIALSWADIKMACLCSDPLAVRLWSSLSFDTDWFDVEDVGGMYFIHNNSDTPNFTRSIPISDALKEMLDKKVPIPRGITPEHRAFLTGKRVTIAEKFIITQEKLVFCFGNAYKTYPRANDGRACIQINNQFIPSLKLSGFDAPIAPFLNFDTANLALTEWRFDIGRTD